MQKVTTWLWFDAEAEEAAVDLAWNELADGGEEIACGWVTDRYGVAWQIVPKRLRELLADPDRDKAKRAMAAMLQMTKIEIEELERVAA